MNVDFFGNDDDGYERIVIPNGYLQADQPRIADVEWDWFIEIDDDLWQMVSDSAPVGPDAPPRPVEDTFDHFIEIDDDQFVYLDTDPVAPPQPPPPADPWDFEQGGEDHMAVASGYQQLDVPLPPQYFGEHSEQFDENLEPVAIGGGYQQGDIVAPPLPFYEEFQDWDEVVREFFADDFGNDDAAGPGPEDPWDYYSDDAAFEPIAFSIGYQQQQPAVPSAAIEDAWDWSDQDASAEDPWQQIVDDDDDAVGPNAPAAIAQDEWDFTQDDAEDPWQLIVDDDDDAIQAAPNGALNLEDAFDQSFDDSDAADETPGIVATADFALIDAPVQPLQFYEDAADHWSQDSDDDTFVALDTDPVVASVIQPQPAEDPFEPTQDADDEEWTARDSDPVGPDLTVQAFDDAWDWTQDEDEPLVVDEIQSVDLVLVVAPADGWEWFADDIDHDFDWALEPNALVATIPILPSQFTDDAWDWTEWLEVEDQVDEDHVFVGSLPYGTGSTYWRIVCPARAFSIASPNRVFRILSNMPSARFPAKDPSEAIRLLYDFTAQLGLLPVPNALLVSITSVTIGNVFGGDNSLVQNGPALLLAGQTQMEVPVLGGLNENDYSIRVVVQTTDPLTILELTGILPVRS